jgi:hypothetical protein
MPPSFSSLTSGTPGENQAPSVPLQHIYKVYCLSYHEYGNIILFFSDFKMLSFWNVFNSGIIPSTKDGTWSSKGNVKAVVKGLEDQSNMTSVVNQYFSNILYKHVSHLCPALLLGL